MSTGNPATTELYWLSAALLTLVDFSAVFCLAQCIPAARFRQVRNETILVAIVFWGGLWAALMVNDYVWEGCYCYVFTEVQRWVMPLLMALINGVIGYGIWWASIKLPWHPVMTFAGLGALASLPEHFYAIIVKDLLDTPLLNEVSMTSAFVFGIFEFVFYWILILSLAMVIRSALDWWSSGRQRPSNFLLKS